MRLNFNSFKNILLLSGIIFSIISLFYLLTSPFKEKKWKITFDPEKIKFKERYLSELEQSSNPDSLPNIILILADDLGKADLSIYGNKIFQTPNIDAIGKKGVTCTEGYISSPICAPSRAGLMTGRYQQRFGFEINIHERYPRNGLEYFFARMFVSKDPFIISKQNPVAIPDFEDIHKQGLPPTEIILPEILKKQGYQTAIFGKWHLGYNETAIPKNRGFDYHYGFLEAFSLYAPVKDENIVNYPHENFTDKHIWGKGRTGNCAIHRNGSLIEEKTYLTEKIADESIEWMEKNHKKGPFFMYIPFSAPHTPFQALKKHYDLFPHIADKNKRVYYAMIVALDEAIGKITQKLEQLNLTKNTIIIFLSDNGGATYTHAADNSPLKFGKFSNFEGGINIPFMIKWPGKIPENNIYNEPVSALDIFTTITSITKAKLPEDRQYDGVNLLPYLSGTFKGSRPHETLYWRSMNHKAVRKGPWKLIYDERSGSKALYNLIADKSESKNLAAECKETVKMLLDELSYWEKDLMNPLWPRIMDFKMVDGEEVYYFPL